MHIESSVKDATLTMRLTGELDLVVADKFKSEADKLIMKHNPKILILNLEKVPFIDSSGLGAILGRYKAISEKGGKVILVAAKAPVRKILELSGFQKIMDIYKDDFDTLVGQG